MSSRPHGRGMRGGHHHHGGYGHHGGHWVQRGGSHGSRLDYHQQHNHGPGRSPRPGMRHADPEKLLASLGPDAQLALTTAIINTVLKSSDEKEGRGNFRDNREQNYHNRDHRREGRGGYYREEMRPRRPYGEPRRYDSRWHNEEGRGHHFEREKGNASPPRHQYGNRYPPGPPKRRLSPQMHPGPTYKRQRMEQLNSNNGERESHRDLEYLDDGINDMERPKERDRRAPDLEEEHSRRGFAEGMEGDSGLSGVQVTIRADGERAVNSDGHVRRVAGRLFVELRCPHCPNQKSITFKEYKMHLTGKFHRSRLQRLARKHTIVLRKIRAQQRQEQKDIENKWKEEKPDEFKTCVSRFCNACKLAFKCLSSNAMEGISQHNRSKLHRMQRHYLHPRCGLCRITFPTRMDYERHVASINHLRVRTATIDNQGNSRRTDDNPQEEERGDLDFSNFMTLDSVGEDDEEAGGSEHEEITGGMDVGESPEKEDLPGVDDLESISGQSDTDSPSRKEKDSTCNSAEKKALGVEEEEELDDMLETEWDKEQHEEEEEEGHKPLGTEYVRRIEAYYCNLCHKIIRADSSLGSRAVQRHCRSFRHLSHYRDHHPNLHHDEEGQSGDDGEVEVELVDELDQDKLWEEVNKGLTALQGELLTDMENVDGSEEKEVAESKKEGKENEVKNSKEEPEVKDKEHHKEEKAATCDDSKATEDWEEVGEDFPV